MSSLPGKLVSLFPEMWKTYRAETRELEAGDDDIAFKDDGGLEGLNLQEFVVVFDNFANWFRQFV